MMRALLWLWQGLVNVVSSIRFRIEGESMSPSLEHGEHVLAVRTRFSWNKIRRGDGVIFERPTHTGATTLKRVVGLPDEDVKITDGQVFINEELLAEDYVGNPGGKDGEWFNGPDEYFLMGDNRGESTDSRYYGPVAGESIRARVWYRCWPPL